MLSTSAAIWFAPFCIPIAIWVALSDMKRMKIPNMASILMVITWAVVGLIVFPLATWAWGWALLLIVLVVGIILHLIAVMGAGDSKFMAAMAPVFVTGDLVFILKIVACCMIGALVIHRTARALPPVRRATPDWESWTRKDFPMGLALSGTLIFYVLAPFLA